MLGMWVPKTYTPQNLREPVEPEVSLSSGPSQAAVEDALKLDGPEGGGTLLCHPLFFASLFENLNMFRGD